MFLENILLIGTWSKDSVPDYTFSTPLLPVPSTSAGVCSCLSAVYRFIVLSPSGGGTSVILQVNLIYWYLLKRRMFSLYVTFFFQVPVYHRSLLLMLLVQF